MTNQQLGGPGGRSRSMSFMNRVTGVVGAIVGLLVLATILVFGFMVSLVVIPVILIVAAGALGYFWFKTRDIRKELQQQMQAYREQMPGQRAEDPRADGTGRNQGTVIEGDEYIHESRTDRD
jgi:uncharacterized membrane protein